MTLGQRRVVGLLLEDHKGGHDRQARLDHRRELTREDLQRLRLDGLLLDAEEGAAGLCDRSADLLEPLRHETVPAQRVARRGKVRCLDLAAELDPWALMAL